ncbi:hypothetical protein cypCar_00028332 [Cyprinus carpio]|nr:hypothetical protein cypCar_00028332 [Cyprinus carpio]
MGQGQEVHPRRLLAQSMSDGGWLLLQNCHLRLEFLDEGLETVTPTCLSGDLFSTLWPSSTPHSSHLRPVVPIVIFPLKERCKFAPLGWNIPYEFNQADFTSSVQFVQNHLDDIIIKRGVNWTCLRYMQGEVRSNRQKMGVFQPMTIFHRQEYDRMQRVIGRVHSTLTDLKLAIDETLQKPAD